MLCIDGPSVSVCGSILMVLNCINGLGPPGEDQYVVGYKLIFDNVGMSDYQSVNHIQDWSGKNSQDATT